MTPVSDDEMARLTAFYEDYARNRMKLPEGIQAPGSEAANNAEDAKRTTTEVSSNAATKAPELPTSVDAGSNASASHHDNPADPMESLVPEETPEGELESFEDYACRIMGLPKGTKIPLVDEIMEEAAEEEHGPTPDEAAANLRRVLEERSVPAPGTNASQPVGDGPTWPMYPLEDLVAPFPVTEASSSLGEENTQGGPRIATRFPGVTVRPGDGKRWWPIMERNLGECSVEKTIAQVAREGQKIDGLLELMKTTAEYDDVDVLDGEE